MVSQPDLMCQSYVHEENNYGFKASTVDIQFTTYSKWGHFVDQIDLNGL